MPRNFRKNQKEERPFGASPLGYYSPSRCLPCLSVQSVPMAETAVFFQFKAFRVLVLILHGGVIALFALDTSQCDVFPGHDPLPLCLALATIQAARSQVPE